MDGSNFTFIPNAQKQFSNNDIKQDDIIFYQLATFVNPTNNKYHLRRFLINSNNKILNLKEYYVDKNFIDKLTRTKKNNAYKMYSLYDLSETNYPSISDISLARSPILQQDNLYSGYALL